MKKILLLTTIVLTGVVTVETLAFGGHRGERSSSAYGSGVSSIGVHYNGTSSGNILPDCPEHGTWSGSDCQCNEGYYMDAGQCLENPCVQAGVRPSTRDGSCTICINGNVYLSYNENPCSQEASEDYTGCRSNDECDDGQYCELIGNDGSCYPTQGTCQEIKYFSDSDPEDTITQLLGSSVRLSYVNMTWWSAENWCRAQGKQLLPVEDLQCYKSGTSTLYTENMAQYGYCCAGNGATCSYVSNWYTSSIKDNYSPVLYAVGEAFNFTTVNNIKTWTASNYGKACEVYYMVLDDGGVSHLQRDGATSSARALCK